MFMDAPAKRPVEVADLFRFKWVTFGALSPDGAHAAYTVAHVDPKDEKQYSAIWLVSLETGDARQLTSGTATDSSPSWSPDGKQIAFMSTRGEKPQLYVIAIDGGEARPLTTLKQGVGSGAVWSPDGKHLAFTASPITDPRDQSKPYRVTRSIYRFNAMEYLDDVVQDLYVMPAGGGEPRQVTKDATMNSNPQWSPDGKELLYLASMQPDSFTAFFGKHRVINLVDGSSRDVLGEWGYVGAASWTPDGSQVVFTGKPRDRAIGAKYDLWVVPSGGGEPECRTAGLAVGVGGGLEPDMPVLFFLQTVKMDAQGQHAYVPVQDGGTVHIYKVALSGGEACTPLVTGDRAAELVDVAQGRLLYMVTDFNAPPDLYCANADGGDERRLTSVNEEFLRQLDLPRHQRLLFPGSDGVQVEGFAWLPPTGAAPYPTVLIIHGGPHGAFGHIFNFNAQMLCGAGYAVLQINHRASTGYGDAFSTAITADWGNLDYKDLMAGVDYAIAQGIADPNKLGVSGLSGGGNLSCWIVGHTTRFKAAVPENPVTNWVSFYGVSDIGPWFAVHQMGGHPHEVPEVYARCSPITYAHHCKTPTLLVQAEHDWRCPPEQSEQFYTVLKVNGCTVEMLRLPNDAHGATIAGAPAARRAHNEALLDWMNRHVLGKQPEAAK
jgi:dipeptidyl aminopeptidase/acylaminoacyl peptidase